MNLKGRSLTFRGDICHCFVEFISQEAALKELIRNWNVPSEFQYSLDCCEDLFFGICVKNLHRNVTSKMLLSEFKIRYSHCCFAKIPIDTKTGRSRFFGFLYFTDRAQRDKALMEMGDITFWGQQIDVQLPKKERNHVTD